MSKCQCCKKNERNWIMQPFGPDEKVVFVSPGSQYRGFPAIGICDRCKEHVEIGIPVTFRYRGKTVEVCRLIREEE